MKKILTFLLASISVIYHSQKINFSSDIQILYQLSFKPDSTQTKISDNLVSLYLNSNEKKSIFQDYKKYKIDSLIEARNIQKLPSLPMYTVNHVVFKDLSLKKITYSEVIDNTNFAYNESIDKQLWTIGNENKQIMGIECENATINFYGRTYTAWFAKSLSFSDGPYKFSGLPGLILEIYDSDRNFHYKLLEIKKDNITILYNQNYSTIERRELRDSKINNIMKNTKKTIKLNPMEKY